MSPKICLLHRRYLILAIDRVLILEPTPHTDAVCAILGAEVRVDRGPLTRDELRQSIADYGALFARLGHRIDGEMLERATRLRAIATPTTGLTHIDVQAARARGIDILCLRGEQQLLEDLPATAELTWGLLLAVLRRIAGASRHTLSGGWDRDLFWSGELAGKTLGIIGLGRLGRKVARYGNAFGMTVMAHDIDSAVVGENVTLVDKTSLLQSADVVSLHASYNQGDLPILAAKEFEQLKPGSILINTARGELVDEAALIAAICAGRVSGAGLDVLANEPHVSAELLRLQESHDVVISPHIGGATRESIMKTELFIAGKLRDYVANVP
jgi:D-3-phosphoglycerate dehydrogenase / 2-oxoglutarate reductase